MPISVKTSDPQLLTGPKPRGLERRAVRAAVWSSEHGRTVSLRNKAATLTHSDVRYDEVYDIHTIVATDLKA